MKPVSEMSDEEILAEVAALRSRRATARERTMTAPRASGVGRKKKDDGVEITGELAEQMRQIMEGNADIVMQTMMDANAIIQELKGESNV